MAEKSQLIVSEKKRPLIQVILAALCFTASIANMLYFFLIIGISNFSGKGILGVLEVSGYLLVLGIGFCSVKKVYVDLEHSKFRPVIEVLGLKFGRWTKITNYEYISVFHQYLQDGKTTFEVNLWYNRNKHLELYRSESIEEAILFGFNISEDLDIDLLDATKKESEWIDKDEWLKKMAG